MKNNMKRIISVVMIVTLLFTIAFSESMVISAQTEYENVLDLSAPSETPANSLYGKPYGNGHYSNSSNGTFGSTGYTLIDTALTDLNGRYLQAAGDVIFEVSAPITDYSFTIVNDYSLSYSVTAKGTVKIFVSSDKAEWIELTDDNAISVGNKTEQGVTYYYYTWSGSLKGLNNYKYIKVTFTNPTGENYNNSNSNVYSAMRMITDFKYNTGVAGYTNTLDLSNPLEKTVDAEYSKAYGNGHYSKSSNGTFGANGWTLTDTSSVDNDGNYLQAEGEVIYKVEAPITDYNFTIINNWSIKDSIARNGTVKIYVSSDKISWVELTDTVTASSKNQTEYGVTYYSYNWEGSFEEALNYRYIKATFINPTDSAYNNSSSDVYSALRMFTEFKYNVGALDYVNTVDLLNDAQVPEGLVYGNPYGNGHFSNSANGTFGKNGVTLIDTSHKDKNGRYLQGAGDVIYRVGNVISDYSFTIVNNWTIKDSLMRNGTVKVYVSTNRIEWLELTDESTVKFNQTSEGGVTYYFYNWSGMLDETKGYRYIKFSFVNPTNSSYNNENVDVFSALRMITEFQYNDVTMSLNSLNLSSLHKVLLNVERQVSTDDYNSDGKVDIRDLVNLKKKLSHVSESPKISNKDIEQGVKLSSDGLSAYMDDNLDNFDKIYEKGNDLTFATSDPAMFDNDFSRVIRTGDSEECWFTYKFDYGIREFAVINYPGYDQTRLDVYVSSDNINWTKLENPIIETAFLHSDWDKNIIKYYNINPENIYVKVDIGEWQEGENSYSPNIGRIRINNIDALEDEDSYLEGRISRTYYVDSVNGSDINSGLSESNALATLSKVSEKYLQPGDKILLKAGAKFSGSLSIIGNGTANNKIIISTYGGDEKAKIVASNGNAVNLKGSYVTVENLEITNPNGNAGIYAIAGENGENANITIRNCYIYKVNTNQNNFSSGSYDHGGIIISVDGTEATWLDNVLIENNTIEETSRCGILVSTNWAYRPARWGKEGYYVSDEEGWYPTQNLVIRSNTVTKCFGDSILVLGAKGALIEKNSVIENFNQSKVDGIACAALWTSNTNDSVIQYNEVAYSHLPEGCNDGEAFDIDIADKRTTIQYNYSHDNEGGFLLMCSSQTALNSGVRYGDYTVRFNLSVNDGSSAKDHGVFMIDSENPGTHIYNNTIYMTADCRNPIRQYYRTTSDLTFTNNIFYGEGSFYYWKTDGGWENTVFNNNVMYNVGVSLLKLQSGITVNNEKTENPNFANSSIDRTTTSLSEVIGAFTPQTKITGAVNVENSGGKDIFGNTFSNIDFYGCVKH